MPIDLTTLSLIFSIIALIPIVLYFIQRYAYLPKLFFRVGGEQSGEPIIVRKEEKITFAVSTKSLHRVFISEVWVYFNPDEVNLSKTKDAEEKVTTDLDFPVALFFPGTRVVKDKILQGFSWMHVAHSQKFSLKLIAYGHIDEIELPFRDMFPARSIYSERIIKFQVKADLPYDLKKQGLELVPGERIQIEGGQAQDAFNVVADNPTPVRVIELFKKN